MRKNLWLLPLALSGALVIMLADASSAQDPNVVEVQNKVESFFDELNETRTPDQAFEALLAGGPLAKHEDFKPLIEKYDRIKGSEGNKFLEVERVAAKKIGSDLLLLRYLYKMEQFPVAWYFTYYRARKPNGDVGDWFVIAVRFDTRLELLGLGEKNLSEKP